LSPKRHRLHPSTFLLALLLTGALASGLAALGQEAPPRAPLADVDDEGVFDISLAGRAVGSESFKIHTSHGKVEARAEIRLHIEQPGKTMEVRSFPDLVMDSQLRPLTYTWNQKGPQSSRLEIDFSDKVTRALYHTVSGAEDDRNFQLPPDVMVLDDNVVHHYQLIAARFQAMGGGKQTFHIFVPQEALPSLLTIEDAGNAPITTDGVAVGLRHLVITTDVTRIDLLVDEQQHVERVSVPSVQLDAVRKK
jgi:hypothetical protein